MNEKRADLRERLVEYALAIVCLYGALPKSTEAQVVGRQLLRSGTSVGAQHREASRARSDAEFISKIESSLQEFEETDYWLELLDRADIAATNACAGLAQETRELIAIFTTSVKTVKNRIQS